MNATHRPVLALTAGDVMSRDLVVVPLNVLVREAVRRIHLARAGEAAVVDERGGCVGMLSPPDVFRWAEAGCPEAVVGPGLTCPYQSRGRLPTGDEAVICTLADGSCPFQGVQPTTGGRHTEVCRLLGTDHPPFGTIPRYMTTDVVTVGNQAPLLEVVRKLTGARADRLVVVDESGRPIGAVSARDALTAVAEELTDEP